jgi:hypothetical protein
MVWLIVTVLILSIIFGAHTYAAAGTGKLTNKTTSSSQPTIFLYDRPSSQLLAEELKFPLAGTKKPIVTRLELLGFEPPGYGLYSYLLFGSSSDAGLNKRYAASRAYCKNFPALSEAVRLGYEPINLNVFQVPTKFLAPDKYCLDPKNLVDNYYDYTLAKKILQDVGLEDDGVYLVACDNPIIRGGCDPKKMLVMNLTPVKETLAELCVLEFRNRARDPKTWNDITLRSLALELRKRLPDMDNFISIAEAAVRRR